MSPPSGSTSTSTSSTRSAPRPWSTTPNASPASRTRSPTTSRTAPLDLAVRSCVAVVSGATALGLAVYRRPRRALAAGGLALALLAASGGTAYATWNPEVRPGAEVLRAALQRPLRGRQRPQHRHRIRRLPAGVGPPGHQRDQAVRRHLHAPRLPAGPHHHPGPARLRHPPQPGELADHRLARRAVRDRRDRRLRRHHGPRHRRRERLPRPDRGPRRALRLGPRQPRLPHHPALSRPASKNVHVLDDGRAVDRRRPALRGHRRPAVHPRPLGRRPAATRPSAWRASASPPPCATSSRPAPPSTSRVAHNPVAARETDGEVPLVLAGHVHHRETEVLQHGTRLQIEGSTGGGGLRAVENEKPEPVQASVLYLDRDDPPPPGLGRDHAGRPGPDDGRGQPPPPGGEPARARPRPRPPSPPPSPSPSPSAPEPAAPP